MCFDYGAWKYGPEIAGKAMYCAGDDVARLGAVLLLALFIAALVIFLPRRSS